MRVKPVCKSCGEAHWMFVKCADAPARNEIEARNATVTKLNVTPQWRTGTPWQGDRLTTLSRTPGTNTFFRKPDPDEPKAA